MTSASFSKDWKIFWSMIWWFQICKRCNAISLELNFKHLEEMSPKVPFFVLPRLLSLQKWYLKISGETMLYLIDVMPGWFLNFLIAISTGPSVKFIKFLSNILIGWYYFITFNKSNFRRFGNFMAKKWFNISPKCFAVSD